MASYELAFEYLLAALETTPGTPIDPPTIYLNMAGAMVPHKTPYRPDEARGTLAEFYRSKSVRKWSELDAQGPADVYSLPFLLETLVKGGGVIATPGGGTLSRTHTYTPTMTSNDLKAATVYWGDPNIQAFQSSFFQLDSLTLQADASGTSGVTQQAKGMGRFPANDSADSVPVMRNAPLLSPTEMLLWLDATTIGTTAITARVVSAEVTIPSGLTRKWLASGPSGGQNFVAVGRKKRHAEMKLVLELPDLTQYNQWSAHTTIKARLRMNGPLIEGALYHYIQTDIYGPFDSLDWGELEGSNRTVALNIISEYDATAGYDFRVVVQNDLATL